MQGFKWFLINEEKAYLGRRIGELLSGTQELEADLDGMGARQIAREAEEIVIHIRKILHGRWQPNAMPHLKELQKIGVAIKKAIEEKGDLKQLIASASQMLAEISGKLGVKVSNIAMPDSAGAGTDGENASMELTPQTPDDQTPGGQATDGQIPQNPMSGGQVPGGQAPDGQMTGDPMLQPSAAAPLPQLPPGSI